MKAISISGSSPDDIKMALEKSMEKGYSPTLAMVFLSVKQDRKAICELLSTHGVDILGATSSGEFCNGEESHGEIVLMLFDISKEHYCLLFEDIGGRDLMTAAGQLAENAKATFESPALIMCSTSFSSDGKMLAGEAVIQGLEKVLDSDINIFGGMAGDDLSFAGSYVFTKDQETSYGIVGLVLNEDKIKLNGVALSGWKPIGITKKITHSEGNLLYSIDDKPAIEIYLRYLGKDPSSVDDPPSFIESIAMHYPIQVDRPGRDPKMCTLIGYDKDKKAMVFESSVPQGAEFRFSMPPDFDIVENVVSSAEEIKSHARDGADALLIFSCAGRLNALGPLAQQENEGLAEVWNVPMAGFYSYGEFGRSLSGRHEFHSTTCSWVALKEKV